MERIAQDSEMTQARNVSSRRAWLLASRPRTLPAALSPVLVGLALAVGDRSFSLLPAVATVLSAVLLQIAANLANDYFDYVKGADSLGRRGPTRVAQSGLIPLPRLRTGIVATLALTAVTGSYLVSVAGWPILLIGLASIVSALSYTGGPLPFGYYGLGDLFVFLFFGVAAVCGTYYIQTMTLTATAVAASLPIGALTVAILVVNNLRDLETDRKAGKRTLAVRLGSEGTRVEYGLLVFSAYVTVAIFWISGWFSPWVMLTWLTIPLAWHLVRTIQQSDEAPALNQALAGTANLALFFSLLMVPGSVV
jgi:1,4-dihydroxy-2-naphthoate octaprenyltransferase